MIRIVFGNCNIVRGESVMWKMEWNICAFKAIFLFLRVSVLNWPDEILIIQCINCVGVYITQLHKCCLLNTPNLFKNINIVYVF